MALYVGCAMCFSLFPPTRFSVAAWAGRPDLLTHRSESTFWAPRPWTARWMRTSLLLRLVGTRAPSPCRVVRCFPFVVLPQCPRATSSCKVLPRFFHNALRSPFRLSPRQGPPVVHPITARLPQPYRGPPGSGLPCPPVVLPCSPANESESFGKRVRVRVRLPVQQTRGSVRPPSERVRLF